jgi:beta-galactosidase
MKPEIRVVSHWVPLVQALAILILGQSAYSSSANLGGADAGVVNASASSVASPRERILLNAGWRFTRDDPAGVGERLRYANIKDWVLPTAAELAKGAVPAAKARPAGNPGGDIPYAQSDFDDSQWRRLNLPHDWGIEGPFKQEYPGETGKLPWWGVGWYRKHLAIPAADAGRRIYLDVDGAMSYATVWLNGQFVGGWPYGYASWRVDLTPLVKAGADNVLAIRLDNPKDSSRWYPGGGIYRNVWLVKTAPVHIAHWGTYVTTPEVSAQSATVKIQVSLENDAEADAAVTVKNEIFELKADGRQGKSVAALATAGVKIAAHQSFPTEGQIILPRPRLWSIERPQRYVVETSIEQDGKGVDHYETPVGIRTIQFTADNGFLLNGKRVPLNGVCDHHDLGALGAAISTRALERQVEVLKQMGGNAIRTSHNPPAPELLEVCDRLGMVVMDEAFDCWKAGKKRNDYHLLFSDWHDPDLRALVRRDRNHPCVILWSIGNEVPDQGTPAGPQLAAELRGIVRSEDTTRPVTSAYDHINSGYNDMRKGVDVFGYNYKPFEYAKFRAANPTQPLLSSETASCISSRGEYFFPVSDNQAGGKADFQMSSYDLYAPPWATTPDAEFRGQDKNPFVAGEFVWTGFDYLGEPTPYNGDMSTLPNLTDPAFKARLKQELDELGKIKVPSRSSYFGIIDLAGFPKDRYYLYQSRWRPDFPMAHVLPHWTWPDRVGQITPVHVYTSGDAAELFLNGKSLGLKKKGQFEYRLRWDDVVYEPGELKVVAYKNGKKWATDTARTASAAAKLMLQPDRDRITADGQDLSFVAVTVADKSGRLVPRGNNHLQFSIEGPADIVAVDNGDATSFEPFQATQRNAYNGLALVIVRSHAGAPGTIVLKAVSPGLASAEVTIKSKPSGTIIPARYP